MTAVPLLPRSQIVARAVAAARELWPAQPGFCDRIQYHLALAETLDRPIGSSSPATGYGTAVEHWAAIPAAYKSHTAAPGDLGFWSGGSTGAGHVAMVASNTSAVSSDAPRPGVLGLVALNYPTTEWQLTFLGFARQWWHGAVCPPDPVGPVKPPVPTILPLVGWDRVTDSHGQWYYRRVVNGAVHVIRDPLPPVLQPGGHWLWAGDYAGTGRWVWS